jgi:hypothetical protein
MDEQRKELAGQLDRIIVNAARVKRAILGGRYNKIAMTPMIHASSMIHGIDETILRLESQLELRKDGSAGLVDGMEEARCFKSAR